MQPEPEQMFRTACERLDGGVQDLAELLCLLVEVLHTALALPVVEPLSAAVSGDPPDLDQAASRVTRHVQDLVDDRDAYWETFDPREEAQPVVGLITDDVADIYRDLRRGLFEAERGNARDALWEWRFSFETHWGNHVTDAIRVLHRLVTGPAACRTDPTTQVTSGEITRPSDAQHC